MRGLSTMMPNEVADELRALHRTRQRVQYRALLVAAYNAGWGVHELSQTLNLTQNAIYHVLRSWPRPTDVPRMLAAELHNACAPSAEEWVRRHVTHEQITELIALWEKARYVNTNTPVGHAHRVAAAEFDRRIYTLQEDHEIPLRVLSQLMGASHDMLGNRMRRYRAANRF
jgi:hypothetical protein